MAGKNTAHGRVLGAFEPLLQCTDDQKFNSAVIRAISADHIIIVVIYVIIVVIYVIIVVIYVIIVVIYVVIVVI